MIIDTKSSVNSCSKLPYVSIVIPMRNEAEYIETCLQSILQGDYQLEKIEILIADGMSDDMSIDIAKNVFKNNGFKNFKIFSNTKQIVSTGLNMAIKYSLHNIIIRMDSHAIYDKAYITESVKALLANKGDAVGGVVTPVGYGCLGESIALAANSKLGTGNAKYRSASEECLVDTVWNGCWFKKTLIELSGFNEDWVVNQDAEMNNRLKNSGKKLFISPKIKAQYVVRNKLSKLARQYFRYGFWRVKTNLAYPNLVNYRQLLPAGFMLLLIGLFLVGLLLSWLPLMMTLLSYFSLLFVHSLFLTRKRVANLFLLPIVFATMHLSWGSGYWMGLFKWLFR